MQFEIPAIIKWLEPCNCFQLLIGVDFMAPVMMRVAWFCTLLTRSKLDMAVVPHAVMPYSSTGLTLLVYSLLRVTVTVSAPHVVPANFFMRASRTLALASAFSVCCFQARRLSKAHHQIGGLSSASRVWPLICRVAFSSFVERLKMV